MTAKQKSTKQTESGSPAGEPVYLVIGYLRRSHGIHGEIIMDLHTDFPERIKAGRKIFIGENHQPHTLGVSVNMAMGSWSNYAVLKPPKRWADSVISGCM